MGVGVRCCVERGRVKKKKGTKRKGDGKRSVFFWGEGEIGKMGGGLQPG